MSNLFLRHGEVENKKNIHYSNLPGFNLSETGKEQASARPDRLLRQTQRGQTRLQE